MEELFPFAIEAGIDAREYWYYSIPEINATIAANRKKLEIKARMDHKLADLIGASVGRLLSNNAKFPSPAEAYPGLIVPERTVQQDWRLAKERLLRYADAHNAKRRGEK